MNLGHLVTKVYQLNDTLPNYRLKCLFKYFQPHFTITFKKTLGNTTLIMGWPKLWKNLAQFFLIQNPFPKTLEIAWGKTWAQNAPWGKLGNNALTKITDFSKVSSCYFCQHGPVGDLILNLRQQLIHIVNVFFVQIRVPNF